MEIKKCVKESFSVVGKEGSTNDGEGFINKLWIDANSHFDEVASLAKTDESGNLLGIWGAMSDFSHSFKSWEDNYSKGLYLAGIEVKDDAQAPQGWVKWIIPSYEYIYAKREDQNTFAEIIGYLKENNMTLAGAVNDYHCPEDGQDYMFFPILKI